MQSVCMLVWILLLSTSQCWSDAEEVRREADQGLPGHMQPLGSHVTPEYVKRVWGEILRGSEFVEQYVHPKQPVIFEGLIRNLTVRKKTGPMTTTSGAGGTMIPVHVCAMVMIDFVCSGVILVRR